MKLCIIADDLTGALDSAAPFAGRGLAVQVALSPEAVASVAASGAQVMAVSTRSRDGTKDAARKAMAQVVAALPAGVPVLKKIDSRLKGHVAAELAVLDPARMLVAPAIPDFGRITQAGHVGGYGVARPLSIAEALGPLAGRAVIPDVTSATELAAALDRTQPGDLLVGARGLAEALAIRMTGQPAATPVLPRAARSLLVIGSRDPITVEQARQVQASGLAAVLPAPRAKRYQTPPRRICWCRQWRGRPREPDRRSPKPWPAASIPGLPPVGRRCSCPAARLPRRCWRIWASPRCGLRANACLG